MTPLHLAVIHDDANFIQENYCIGDAFPRNEWGLTPLDLAHLLDKPHIANLFTKTSFQQIKILQKGEKVITKVTEEEASDILKFRWIDHLKFRDYELLERTLNNCPFILSKGWQAEEQRKTAISLASQLKNGWYLDVTIVYIDDEIRWGLICNQNIEQGTFVGQYVGEVKTVSRFDKSQLTPYCLHYPTKFWSWDYTVIDAARTGGIMRFLNHSSRPNLQPVNLPLGHLLYTGFFAKCFIRRGSLLTFDYGKDF